MEKTDFELKKEIVSAVSQQLNRVLKSPTVTEIGDGNINRVFRVSAEDVSMVVKYASESAVILPTIKLSRNRGDREGKYLALAGKYSRNMLPKVYFYDENRFMLFIEDFGSVSTLSDKLISGDFDSFDVENMAIFTAETCFFTSRYAITKPVKDHSDIFNFHDLCKLTQQLVFEQPFYSHENNHFMPENRSFVEENVYNNSLLKERAEELKHDFINNHEAVIHGDLHTASVFSIDGRNVVFDAEFSYNGPIAFDLGNILAHLLMTYFRWSVAPKSNGVDAETIIRKAYEYLEIFRKRFSSLTDASGKEELPDSKSIVERIISFSYGYAAVECLRRVIGLAKAPIFTRDLSDGERAAIERCLILAGRELLEKDHCFVSANDLLGFVKEVLMKGRN